MSYTSKKQAEKEGKKYLVTMPPGWTLDVFDNLGWHWKLQYQEGLISVYPAHTKVISFCALMTDDRGLTNCGSCIWDHESGFKTPLEAAKATIERAKKKMKEISSIIEDCEKGVK